MIENSDISLIDRHLKNELSPEELIEFNSKLKLDKEFRDFFEMMKPLGLVVERSNLKMDLAEFETELAQADIDNNSNNNSLSNGNGGSSFGLNKIILWLIGSAVVITCLIYFISEIVKPDSQNQNLLMPIDSSNLNIDSVTNELENIDSVKAIDNNLSTLIDDSKSSDSFKCTEEGSSEVIIYSGKAGLRICLPPNAVLLKTDSGYVFSEKQIHFQSLFEGEVNDGLSCGGSGISLSSKGDGSYIGLYYPEGMPTYSFKISLSKDRKSLGVFTFYYKLNLKTASSEIESNKKFGKVSFWTDSGEDGIVKIYIDDKLVGQLDSYFETGQPIFGQKGTFTYSIPTGEHTVLAKSSNREASGKILIEAGDSIIYKLFK